MVFYSPKLINWIVLYKLWISKKVHFHPRPRDKAKTFLPRVVILRIYTKKVLQPNRVTASTPTPSFPSQKPICTKAAQANKPQLNSTIENNNIQTYKKVSNHLIRIAIFLSNIKYWINKVDKEYKQLKMWAALPRLMEELSLILKIRIREGFNWIQICRLILM